jgi:mRNA interferase MazF
MGGNRPPVLPAPRRGEIWFVKAPGDAPDKLPRPAVIVSADSRNVHPRAHTVLAIPFSTTLTDMPTHIRLQPGQTGLNEAGELQAENITTVRKDALQPPRTPLRVLSDGTIRSLARAVVLAMGVQPKDIAS